MTIKQFNNKLRVLKNAGYRDVPVSRVLPAFVSKTKHIPDPCPYCLDIGGSYINECGWDECYNCGGV